MLLLMTTFLSSAPGHMTEAAQNVAAATAAAAPKTPVSFPSMPASFAGTMPSHFGIGSDDPASFKRDCSKDHDSNFSFGTTLPFGGGGISSYAKAHFGKNFQMPEPAGSSGKRLEMFNLDQVPHNPKFPTSKDGGSGGGRPHQ